MTMAYDKVEVGELFFWKGEGGTFAKLLGYNQLNIFSVPGLAGTDVLSQRATMIDLMDGMSLLVLEKRYTNTRNPWVRVLLSTPDKTWDGWVSQHRICCHINKTDGEVKLWVKSS